MRMILVLLLFLSSCSNRPLTYEDRSLMIQAGSNMQAFGLGLMEASRPMQIVPPNQIWIVR